MSDFVLDHLFVMTDVGAPQADDLVARGFAEGPPNRHPGQGTACRRFFFANFMLEFVWVENEEETRSEMVHPLRLWERWAGRISGASPFGIALRPVKREGTTPPFDTFEYWPSFFPAPAQVSVRASIIEEPLYFCLPYFERPARQGLGLSRYRIEGQTLMEIDLDDGRSLRITP